MDPTFGAALALVPAPYGHYVAAALTVFCAVCTVCSAIDAAFPQPRAGSWLVPVRHAIAVGALSLGWARNLIGPGQIPASVADGVGKVQAAATTLVAEAGKVATQAEAVASSADQPHG